MGKHKKLAKSRLDKYYFLAKEQGLRSRSAFKLVQLNRIFDFLSRSQCVVDLCAAPGGWLQICEKTMPVSKVLIGVDLVPIKPLRGCITLMQDITDDKCYSAIRKELQGWKVDAVLHDGSPNVGGAWALDAFGQNALALSALKLGTRLLRQGGLFMTKVFRSRDYNKLLWVCQQFFKRVTAKKPPASRASSAEIYLVCENFLAPNKIDPRLLDPESVFEDVETTKKIPELFGKKNKKKSRVGYDGSEYQIGTVAQFIESDKPQDYLATHVSMIFTEASKIYEQQKQTTDEIKYLCEDLKVLGKKDFKMLLKWWKAMVEFKPKAEEIVAKEGDDDSDKEGKIDPDLDSDEAREKEYEEQLKQSRELMAKKDKKKKRKKHDHKMKQRRKLIGSGIDGEGPIEDLTEPLFSLKSIKTLEELDTIADADINQIGDAYAAAKKEEEEEEEKERKEAEKEEAEADALSDSEAEDEYRKKLETNMDRMYEEYAKRRGHKRRKKRRVLRIQKEAESQQKEEKSQENESGEDADVPAFKRESKKDPALVVNFEATPTQEGVAKRWFARDVFAELGSILSEKPHTESEKAENGDETQSKSAESSPKAGGNAKDCRQEPAVPSIDVEMTDKAEESDEKESLQGSPNEPMDVEESQQGRPSKKVKLPSDASTDTQSISSESQPPQGHQTSPPPTSSRPAISELGPIVSGVTSSVKITSKTLENKSEESDGDSDSDSDSDHLPYKKTRKKRSAREREKRLTREADKKGDKLEPFEEVPADEWSSDSDAAAEVLAIGTAMLRKKRREEIINNAYNRRAFNDHHILPEWFVNDEREHMRANLPVTKQEVEEQKARFRAVNARPIKKIAEAQARKKWKKVKQFEKMKGEADAISASKDMSNKEKLQALEKLHKKRFRRIRQERHYVVSTKGGAKSSKPKPRGTRIKYVDKRMKADARGADVSQRRTKARASKARGGNVKSKKGRKRKRK